MRSINEIIVALLLEKVKTYQLIQLKNGMLKVGVGQILAIIFILTSMVKYGKEEI